MDSNQQMFHMDHHPEALGLLMYPPVVSFEQSTTTDYRLPTPADEQGPSPVFWSGESSQVYPIVGDGSYGGMCHPVGVSAPSFVTTLGAASTRRGYDAVPLESTWSPMTPLTPAGSDGTSPGFLDVKGPFSFAEDPTSQQLSPCNVTGTGWTTHAYPHAELPSKFSDSNVGLMRSGIVDQHETQRDRAGVSAEEVDEVSEASPEPPKAQSSRASPPTEKASTRRKKSSSSESSMSKRRGSSASQEAPRRILVPGQTLRTAARRNKRAEPTAKPGESLQEQRARTSHNQVEKDYRNRLHGHFERLLSVLPGEGLGLGLEGEDETSSGQPATGQGQNKRLSKANVLEKARMHIVYLEDDRLKRKREIAELQTRLEKANRCGR
ncbi:hypothetical protein OQA88_1723 [Cercophora sp. LCS_1]